MNVSLTPKLESFVRRRVASGLYNNASEVVREALRLLLTREGDGADAPRSPGAGPIRAALSALEDELRARGVASLALFGSVPRGDARPDSDVDVLVDLDPQAHASLVDIAAIKNLLTDRLGRAVDVVTRDGLDPVVRDRVLADAERVF